MIKILMLSILLSLSAHVVCGQNIARVEKIELQSKALDQQRDILVYTPVDYDWRKKEYFNVIYVFDSQNREFFDYTSSIISFLTDNSKSFIVVGITSPYNEALDYARNNDLLPVLETQSSKDRYGEYSGNANQFYKYISNEVIPYVESKYRTLQNRVAIGHSLSASFILDAFTKKPDLFNTYIAISPNLAYDNDKLANKLINFDYSKLTGATYMYLSHANEGIDYWQEWKPAREKLYAFFEDSEDQKDLTVQIAGFPDKNHWNTFPPSLSKALDLYFNEIMSRQENELGQEDYEVTIKVKVLKEQDTVYITGNQDAIGNWNPKKVQMARISELKREIKLKLKSPAQFKFTRGSWDSEAEVIGTYRNITIKPEEGKVFDFEIQNYMDR